ncbi:hypothetical protein PCASD_16781 [Puccinia coronata f. sp. avenae]|uniref:Integrase catalytic domain-containing protein n=1 Tax=Puccinia coronata f. sp. avenae TaxID=200324 RepID=A0A2N5TVF5_9BASI|nr:hypothetical protein PCASD_16781 [Puccinia coronata f. sp. avenae]
MSKRTGQAAPSTSQQHARCLADYYRPRYSQGSNSHPGRSSATPQAQAQGQITAHAVEVNGLPYDLDDLDFNSMAIGEDVVSDPAIFDTGALHGFTGSKVFLHNFQLLKKPIPVSVATSGGGSFISGYGDLRIATPEGNVVVLQKVLYSVFDRWSDGHCLTEARANWSDRFVRPVPAGPVQPVPGTDRTGLSDPPADASVGQCLSDHRSNTAVRAPLELPCSTDRNHRALFTCINVEQKRNRWILPHPFLRTDDPLCNGPQLVHALFTSPVPTLLSADVPEDSDHVLPTTLESIDDVEEIQPVHKKHRAKKPTADNIEPPNELADLFKQPVLKTPGYQWRPQPITNEEAQPLYYHRIFGHASLQHICKIIRTKPGSGLPEALPAGRIHCPVCIIGKSTRINPLSSTCREIGQLDIVAVDLIGPFQVDSVEGGKYIMTMRDVATGYCFVRILTHKWEAATHIMEIINRVENFTEKKVKTVWRDNGGKFFSAELATFFAGKGIVAKRSLPYHHYQNGVIERFNRTIANMARTILLDSSLPQTFWSYAFSWAAHTLNRIPNKASGKLTPLEAFLKHRPQYGIFRVFGSTGYAHVPPELQKKLDPRAQRGHVVAYLGPSKGWRLWLPDTDTFVDSAMVRFPDKLKDVPTIPKKPKPLPPPSPPEIDNPSSSAVSQSPPAKPVPSPAKSKLSLTHIMNLFRLGDFDQEVEFSNQELIIDKILELCHFYAISVPSLFKQAMKSPKREEWLKAIAVELNNLKEMRVWAVAQLPSDKKALNGRWVFATKPGTDGSNVRFKARFVAKGFTQVAGVDFNATFAPTATFVSLCLLLTVAAAHQWPVHSFDFVAAYLNLPIDEEIWLKPPEGMDVPPGQALKLEKALYSTQQAARCWWIHLKNLLNKFGYSPSQYDNSLYILRHPDRHGVIWLHVDDGVVTRSNQEILSQLESDLKDILKIKWEKKLTSIVGLSVERLPAGFVLSQGGLIDSILDSHWDSGLTAATPLPPNFNATTDTKGKHEDSGKYLSVIGSLSYLAVGTRPDICFAVNYLARFAAKPGVEHWKGLRHLINYLAGSRQQRLKLFPKDGPRQLKTFADASWGGEFARSTHGVFITFMNLPILWISRRQVSVAGSTCQAEYMVLGVATRQTLWVRHLLKDVLKRDYVGHLFCNNQSAVHVAIDGSSNKRTRHTDRDFYITNESLFQGKTTLQWVPTAEQLADIFTKSLGREPFLRLQEQIMG